MQGRRSRPSWSGGGPAALGRKVDGRSASEIPSSGRVCRASRFGGRPLLRHQCSHSRLRQSEQPAVAAPAFEPARHRRGGSDADHCHWRLRSFDSCGHRPLQRSFLAALWRGLVRRRRHHFHSCARDLDWPRQRLCLPLPAAQSARRHAGVRLHHLWRDLGGDAWRGRGLGSRLARHHGLRHRQDRADPGCRAQSSCGSSSRRRFCS